VSAIYGFNGLLGAGLKRLVYIGGYGRSGSTLLEYLLTASPEVVACGEVSAALHERTKNKKRNCTCGKPVSDCPVWREASCRLDGWTHRDLTLALLEQVESKNAVMLDSSKTAWGSATAPFGFRRTLGRHFHLVHLVRDPRAVCWSTVRRAERRDDRLNGALRCAFTTVGWWTANLACELFGLMYPDQYVRLYYEDLARAPREAVSRLFTALLVEGQPQFETLGKSANRHQLYGNRMRRYPPSLGEIKEDRAWRTAMPVAHRRLVEVLSWPLRCKYGYS
jgi:hypothetical protein